MNNRRVNVFALIYSLIFSICGILGNRVYTSNDIRVLLDGNIFLLILEVVGLGIVTYFSICILAAVGRINKISQGIGKYKISYKYLFVLWPFMLLFWIPVFCAFFPGMDSYDFSLQARYSFGQGFSLYTTHHPPIHTMYINLAIVLAMKIGVHAVTIIGIFQMLLMSFVFCFFTLWLLRRGFNLFLTILVFLFFAINPVISIFVLTPTKDVFLALFLLLFNIGFVEMIDRFDSLKTYQYFIMGLLILACCLFRNNMVYGFVLSIPFIIIVFRKKLKTMCFLWITPIILFFLINNVLFIQILGMEPGEEREKFSVPIQQIANVVVNCGEDLTREEVECFNTYFDYENIVASYNPRFADPVKDLFLEKAYSQDSKFFWQEWLKTGLVHPVEYINGFVFLNMPYWYPFAELVDPYSHVVYIETGNVVSKMDSRNYVFYSKIASGESLSKFYNFCGLFSLATPLWSILLAMTVMFINGRKKYMIVLVPFLGLLLTFFAGPLSNFRYIFAFVCLYPMLIYLCSYNEKYEGDLLNERKNC